MNEESEGNRKARREGARGKVGAEKKQWRQQ